MFITVAIFSSVNVLSDPKGIENICYPKVKHDGALFETVVLSQNKTYAVGSDATEK